MVEPASRNGQGYKTDSQAEEPHVSSCPVPAPTRYSPHYAPVGAGATNVSTPSGSFRTASSGFPSSGPLYEGGLRVVNGAPSPSSAGTPEVLRRYRENAARQGAAKITHGPDPAAPGSRHNLLLRPDPKDDVFGVAGGPSDGSRWFNIPSKKDTDQYIRSRADRGSPTKVRYQGRDVLPGGTPVTPKRGHEDYGLEDAPKKKRESAPVREVGPASPPRRSPRTKTPRRDLVGVAKGKVSKMIKKVTRKK